MLQMTRRQFAWSALAAAGSARVMASDEPVVIELEAARNWVPLDGRQVAFVAYNGKMHDPTMT